MRKSFGFSALEAQTAPAQQSGVAKVKALFHKHGLTGRLYLLILLGVLLFSCVQTVVPTVPESGAPVFSYAYGLFQPWLEIYKTADLGPQNLLRSLLPDYNLPGTVSWLCHPFNLLLDALLLFLIYGAVRWLLTRLRAANQ